MFVISNMSRVPVYSIVIFNVLNWCINTNVIIIDVGFVISASNWCGSNGIFCFVDLILVDPDLLTFLLLLISFGCIFAGIGFSGV